MMKLWLKDLIQLNMLQMMVWLQLRVNSKSLLTMIFTRKLWPMNLTQLNTWHVMVWLQLRPKMKSL
uniref:Putative ovule protein n=1 Tax=Solanum chacoense TaxID=4108 RepID=A0A0V0GI88_SOLCH